MGGYWEPPLVYYRFNVLTCVISFLVYKVVFYKELIDYNRFNVVVIIIRVANTIIRQIVSD